MAALNGGVALFLRIGFKEIRKDPPPPEASTSFPRHHLAALGLASVASAIFQLWTIRVAQCLLGPFHETFALVLALVIYVKESPKKGLALTCVTLALFALTSRGWDESLLYLSYTAFHSTDDLAEARRELGSMETFKGYQDVFAIIQKEGKPYFFINGYTSMSLTSSAEKSVGALAAGFAPRTDRALILGLGSGATASAVGLVFEKTDAVEINPVVVENLHRMSDYNFDIVRMPAVSIHQDDGMHFVKTSRAKYSLVINTVTTPLYFSSSKL